MAEPFLRCPPSWRRASLEPNPRLGLIDRVGTGGTPPTRVDEYWDGDIAWLTPKEVVRRRQGLHVTHTERRITEAGLRACGAQLLETGAVMLTKRAPVGAVAVAGAPMATNQGFLNFTCGPHLRPLYLAYWLLANRPYLDLVANGSTYPELYKSDLFEFEIAAPAVDVQDRIVDFLTSLQLVILLGLPLEHTATDPAHVHAIQEQTRRLQQARDALLPRLLAGEWDVDELAQIREARLPSATTQPAGTATRPASPRFSRA